MNDECFICGSPKYHEYHSLIQICNACEEMINNCEMTVHKKVQVHVAHYIPGHVKCGNMHGHALDIDVGIRGKMDFTNGMVVDFGVLKEVLQKEIIDRFDHGCLNDIIPCPTAEYLAAYIYFQLNHRRFNVVSVRVHETEDNYVEFTGDGDV